MKKVILISLCMIALVAFAMWAPDADAYMRYNDGCQTCHGAFSDDISPKGSVFPGNGGKHGMHRDGQSMNTECDLCHSQGDNKNPLLNVSDGTDNNTGVGCSGCHEENGLRLYHLNNGVNACLTCHTNDPPPPAEGTMPPYYGTVDTLANMPCNDVAQEGINENWSVGDTLGLDNDGDNAYDMADTDCSGPSGPGVELSMPDLAVDAGQSVTLPVTYTANGNEIPALLFSVDFDEANLIFDGNTNTTGLPWPDSITVNPLINPFIFSIGFEYQPGDTDGELDFTFTDITLPFGSLPEGDIVIITFTAGPNTAVAPVVFSQDPNATAGNIAGEDVPVTTVDGSVTITSTTVCGDGVVEGNEDCDDGAANGTTTCGCQTDCTYTAAGTSCDDGQFCNGTDTCDGSGNCQAGTPPSVDDGVGCTDDSCDEVNDTVVNAPNDGLCDNGQFCDGTETCDPVNDCQAGTAPSVDDGVACTDDSCDEVNDIILNIPNDGLCDNGQFCDGAETCDPVNDCQAGTSPSVDDGVACTDDSCDEVNDVIVNAPNDGLCDNGQFCDGTETCDPVNDCQAGTAPSVDDGVPCTDDSCDEANDVIVNAPNDGNCDNSQFCDGSETCDPVNDCQAGTPPVVDDGVGCTDDSCDEVNDVIVNSPNNGLCDNGQFCDGSETCDPVNDCQEGTPPSIDDGVACTDDSCDEVNDVIVNAPNDGLCDNGQFCDGSETCDPVNDCQAGIPPVVDDSVGCTDDSCDEANDVIVNAPNDGNCDNSQFCDGSETCDPVNDCQAGTPPVVDDGVGCTDDFCDEATDTIVNAPNNNNCSDGLFCNGAETCDPVNDCQAGIEPCTPDECDEIQDICGCTSDADCDNGLFCDGVETCNLSTNVCEPGTPPVEDDGVGCTDDSCDEATDTIVNAPNNANCSDGLFCNGSEICDPVNDCQAGTDPCLPGETCNEADDICIVDCQGSISINTGQTLSGNPIDLTSIVTTNDAANLIYTVTEEGSGSCDVNPNGTYIEAENFTGTINQGSATFSVEASQSGYSGSGYLLSNGGSTGSCPPVNEGKEYQVNFPTAGTYTVWMRGYAIGSSDNSVFIGLDGNCVGALTETLYNAWTWTKDIQSGSNTITVSTAGIHTINVWVREPDHKIDGIYLDMAGNIPTDGSHGDEIDPNNCGGGSTTLFIGDEIQAQSVDTTGWTDGVKNLTVDGDDATCGTPLTVSGTFTFEGAQCIIDADCDDGAFCNGEELCDANGNCQAGTPPSVDDGVACTDDSCDEASDTIVNTPNDGLCDNGQFCDGSETCDPVNDCQAGVNPCTNGNCNEINDVCGCTTDADCDDGLFCNGTEICDVNSACQPGIEPCFAGDVCDEDQDICIAPPVDLDIDIRGFRIDSSLRVGESLQRIQLTIENTNGPSTEGALATLTGIQDGKQVYYEERTVWDVSRNGKARFAFPSYTPIKAGDINWTLEILDSDPDIDIETDTTRVRSSGNECVTDADCDDGLFCNGEEKCGGSGTCKPASSDPCSAVEVCDEVNDVCE